MTGAARGTAKYMILKNIHTGEELSSTALKLKDGQIVGDYEFKTRFYNKYGKAVEKTGNAEDGKPIFSLHDGWEIAKASKARKPKASKPSKPIAEPEPTATEPEPIAEPTQVVEPEPQTEPTTEPAQPTIEPTQTEPTFNTGSLQDGLTAAFMPVFSGVAKQIEANVMAKVQPILDKAPVKHVIEVRTPQGMQTLSTDIVHVEFERLVWLVNNNIPTYIYGPAGSGKNVLCAQVAEALGLTFYYCGAISDEFKLKGYGNAAGEYVPTEFYRAFTQGGLLMLDELDASDPQVLVAINAAISQRYVDFPVIGRVDAHPDFRVVSAGNTFGTGASMAYTGRSSLDASTLNRFGYLKVDYDPRIDLCCAGNDKELCEFGHGLRKAAELTGLSLLVSYRQFTMMSQLLAGGKFTTEHAIEFAITKGMQRDELVILDNALDINDNKYAQALHRLTHA